MLNENISKVKKNRSKPDKAYTLSKVSKDQERPYKPPATVSETNWKERQRARYEDDSRPAVRKRNGKKEA